MVTASGNHDPRHFENPDEIDLYRDNTTDHLTFGYGSHQCLGKNIARMEMRIFLEEFTRRLPHMELMPQEFTFLPNTSFRGPEHLWVRWDPARNPERTAPAALTPRLSFDIGAPASRQLARAAVVTERETVAEDVVRLVVSDPKGRPMPRWSAGGHVDLLFGDYERKYSLCGDVDAPDRLEIVVLKEPESRGGSVFLHETLMPGSRVSFRGPKNHFRLDERAEAYVLVAGGIGITPILAMADRLKRLGKRYEIHYAGRTRARMAFMDRLERDHGHRLALHPGDEGRRMDLSAVLGAPAPGRQVYACGPDRLLAAIATHCEGWPEGALHMEYFTAGATVLDPTKEEPFVADLADSGLFVTVDADRTLLEALRAAGIDVPSDCEEGLCGTCEVAVLEGEVDHRDRVLSETERREGSRMMACCSRAKGRVKLAL